MKLVLYQLSPSLYYSKINYHFSSYHFSSIDYNYNWNNTGKDFNSILYYITNKNRSVLKK